MGSKVHRFVFTMVFIGIIVLDFVSLLFGNHYIETCLEDQSLGLSKWLTIGAWIGFVADGVFSMFNVLSMEQLFIEYRYEQCITKCISLIVYMIFVSSWVLLGCFMLTKTDEECSKNLLTMCLVWIILKTCSLFHYVHGLYIEIILPD